MGVVLASGLGCKKKHAASNEPVSSDGSVATSGLSGRPVTATDLATDAPVALAQSMPEAMQRGQPLGAAAPSSVVSAADSGAWVVACQAQKDTDRDGKLDVTYGQHGDTHGDELQQYLVIEGGPGVAIEQVIAASDDEARLLVRRDSRIELVDTSAAEVTAQPMPVTSGVDPVGDFGPTGRLVYARGGTVVVEDAGPPRAFDLGSIIVGQVEAIDDHWVRIFAVTKDTDGDGKLALPKMDSNRPDDPCAGPYLAMTNYGRTGDQPRVLWLDTAAELLVDEPTAVYPTSAGWLARSADGALVHGAIELAPASCKPIAEAILASPLRVAYVCSADGEKSKVRVVGEGLASTELLELPVPPTADIPVSVAEEPVQCSQVEQSFACIDLSTASLVEIRDPPIAVRAGRVLVRSAGSLVIVDGSTGARTPLNLPDNGEATAAGPTTIVFDGKVIDLVQARVLGSAPSDPILGIAADGRALVATSGSAHQSFQGPFRWVAPTP